MMIALAFSLSITSCKPDDGAPSQPELTQAAMAEWDPADALGCWDVSIVLPPADPGAAAGAWLEINHDAGLLEAAQESGDPQQVELDMGVVDAVAVQVGGSSVLCDHSGTTEDSRRYAAVSGRLTLVVEYVSGDCYSTYDCGLAWAQLEDIVVESDGHAVELPDLLIEDVTVGHGLM